MRWHITSFIQLSSTLGRGRVYKLFNTYYVEDNFDFFLFNSIATLAAVSVT